MVGQANNGPETTNGGGSPLREGIARARVTGQRAPADLQTRSDGAAGTSDPDSPTAAAAPAAGARTKPADLSLPRTDSPKQQQQQQQQQTQRTDLAGSPRSLRESLSRSRAAGAAATSRYAPSSPAAAAAAAAAHNDSPHSSDGDAEAHPRQRHEVHAVRTADSPLRKSQSGRVTYMPQSPSSRTPRTTGPGYSPGIGGAVEIRPRTNDFVHVEKDPHFKTDSVDIVHMEVDDDSRQEDVRQMFIEPVRELLEMMGQDPPPADGASPRRTRTRTRTRQSGDNPDSPRWTNNELFYQEGDNYWVQAKDEEVRELHRIIGELDAENKQLRRCYDGTPDSTSHRRPRFVSVMLNSYRRHPCCWLLAWLLLLLLFIILFAIFLARYNSVSYYTQTACHVNGTTASPAPSPSSVTNRTDPSSLTFAPTVQALSNSPTSMDFSVQLLSADTIYYAVLTSATVSSLTASGTFNYSAVDVATACSGYQANGLQSVSIACGQAYINTGNAAYTLSIAANATYTTTECRNLAVSGVSGFGPPLCYRCPTLQPATSYQVLFSTAASRVAVIAASTAGQAGNIIPSFQTPAPKAVGISEDGFVLSFTLDTPGLVHYLVLYQNVYGRFVNSYVAYQPSVVETSWFTSGDLTTFTDGIVARGTINVTATATPYACTIAGAYTPAGGCTCGNNPCPIAPSCYAGLCGLSRSALAPAVRYQVLLLAESPTGGRLGVPVSAGTFSTLPQSMPPTPSSAMAVGSIQPTGFTLQKMQMSKIGYSLSYVGMPFAQPPQFAVRAGTSTPFVQVPFGSRRRARSLLQSAVELYSDPAGLVAGSSFLPPGNTPIVCPPPDYTNASMLLNLTAPHCSIYGALTDVSSWTVSNLANDRYYVVTVVPGDLANNEAAWQSVVHTVDTTPPSVVQCSAQGGFTDFTLNVQLSENATLWAVAVADHNLPQVTVSATCPLVAMPATAVAGQQVGVHVAAANTNVALTFNDASIVSNTNYTVFIEASDTFGNCITQPVQCRAQTYSPYPPSLGVAVVNRTCFGASLVLTVNETSTVSYMVYRTDSISGAPGWKPAVADLFGQLVTSPAVNVSLNAVDLPSPATVLFNAPTVVHLATLDPGTSYTVCATAQEVGPVPPVAMTSVVCAPAFTTINCYTPQYNFTMLNVTCSRTTMTCTPWVSGSINETGTINYIATPQALNYTPTAGELFSQQPWAATFPNCSGSISMNAFVNTTGSCTPAILDETAYTMHAAAMNSDNYLNSTVWSLDFVTPDVTPPGILHVAVASLQDYQVTLNITMNETGSITYGVLLNPSTCFTPPVPYPSNLTVAQVVAGVDASNHPCPSKGSWLVPPSLLDSSGNYTGLFTAYNLTPATYYDICMVPQDPNGIQATVVTCITVRTVDHRQPAVLSLGAVWLYPQLLNVTATVNKTGTVYYVARKATDPAPTYAEVLAGVPAFASTPANFTEQFAVAANTAVSDVVCAADGNQLVLYAVAQDQEGYCPNGVPNYSVLQTVPTTLYVPPPTAQVCRPQTFLSALQPSLSFTGPGLPLGPLLSNMTGTGMVWTQPTGFFRDASLASASVAQVIAGPNVAPPGSSIAMAVTGLPPAQILVILQNPTTLILEDNSVTGSNLQLAYQLLDSSLSTMINTNNMVIRPQLSYTSGTPAGVFATSNILANCDPTQLSSTTGIGTCSIPIASKYFPTSGATAAAQGKITLTALINGSSVVSSAAAAVTLNPSPAHIALSGSTPGVLVTMPYRTVNQGEVIKVSVTAYVPGGVGATGYGITLSYGPAVTLINTTFNAIWPTVVPTPNVNGAGTDLQIAVMARTPNTLDSLYRGSSVPLLDMYFRVQTNAINSQQAVSIPYTPTIYPFVSTTPQVQFNDYRGGPQSSGAINIITPVTRGMLAYAAAYNIPNTAVFSGTAISVPITAVTVNSWGDSVYPAVQTVSGAVQCSAPANVSASMTISNCVIGVQSFHKGSAKAVPISVMYQSFTANLAVSVWYPSSTAVAVQDPILNSVLPINANPAITSCADRFQSSRINAYANWTNGGSSVGDAVAQVDITSFATFATNDSAAVMFPQANLVQGSSARSNAVILSLNSNDPQLRATANLQVSNQSVCLMALSPLATTGFAFLNSPTPSLAGQVALNFEPRQDLTWEQTSAYVLTSAIFSDGATMDVTDVVNVAGINPSPGTNVPISLGTDPTFQVPLVTVNASVGIPNACAPYLSASWSVCSGQVPLGDGNGTVTVLLPTPKFVAALTATPPVIAPVGDPMASGPQMTATTSLLTMSVAFSDNTTHDFSADPRTSYAVVANIGVCRLRTLANGSVTVYVDPTAVSPCGTCVITGSVTFPTGTISRNVSVQVVSTLELDIYFLSPTLPALPSLNSSQLPVPSAKQGLPQRLFKCDWRNYDQYSIWSLGELCSCPGQPWCSLYDVTSRTNFTVGNTALVELLNNNTINGQTIYELVPLTAGTTGLDASYATGVTVGNATLSIEDTFLPGWPAVANITDTSVVVQANMSTTVGTNNLYIVYWMLPANKLSPAIDPGANFNYSYTASYVLQNGIQLAKDTTGGATYYDATLSNLVPGTNYTLLMAMRSGIDVVSSVTAITSILVPDHKPPTYTGLQALNLTYDDYNFYFSLNLQLNEQAQVHYSLYRGFSCVTADPSVAQVWSFQDLNSTECGCSNDNCRIAADGNLAVNYSLTTPVSGPMPLSPYASLASSTTTTQMFCHDLSTPYPWVYSESVHYLYLVAQDYTPTYKNWDPVCTAPIVSQSTPPSPCAPMAYAPCSYTLLNDTPNQQSGAWGAVDLSGGTVQTAAPYVPIKAKLVIADTRTMDFDTATTNVTWIQNPSDSSITVTFWYQITKPGLVRFALVANIVQPVIWGVFPVLDTSAPVRRDIPLSTLCDNMLLQSGTSYAFWYNATDNYNVTSRMYIQPLNFPVSG